MASGSQRNHFLCGILHPVRNREVHSRFANHALTFFDVRALESYDDRNLYAEIARGFHHSARHHIERTMPPKMLIKTAFTFSSASRIRNAASTRCCDAPPPTSRKFAGSPPASLMMSIVAIASPAPFTMQAMLPSSLM